ncbi:hypothetical protein F404_gp137 [Vibrio phage pVp-1]|uniref:Uncharacterized protein n=1 Tax=Vibrio phage pVp-1 TaxID=1150989 RepID=H6WXM8_9CAUD|nr:hypothetical protein F404_gp137 [Vibrio phage pVp-1]AFB83994.1 hypothetical protein pVp-1_0137 [Vibrio phage pVp-1]
MALFMGRKPSDNRPLLHVTSGNESLSQLDGAPIASTLFHSDIPYLAIYDIVEITQFRHVETVKGYKRWDHYYEPIVPQKVWDYINQRQIMFGTQVYYNDATVTHTPLGTPTSRSPEAGRFGIFIGNFQGSSFGRDGSPYPSSPVPNTSNIYGHWDPLTVFKAALQDKNWNIDQGIRAGRSDREGVWNVSGLQRDTISTYYQYYRTANISKTSRSTSANYSNPTRDLVHLFGRGGTGRQVFSSQSQSAPKTLTYSSTKPSSSNFKLRIYVLNVKYNSQNNVEHVKPPKADGIKISREDMVIGDLSMKNGMLLSDPAPMETSMDSTRLNTIYNKVKPTYFEKLIKGLTPSQLADYPFLHYFQYNLKTKAWRASGASTIPLVHSPSALLGSNISLEFSADEIKYKGSKGEFLIASKARKYTPYILGGDTAITAIFPAETKTFAQLRQGTYFQKKTFSGPRISIYNPNDIGVYKKEIVKQRIKLPPGSTSKNYLTVHISPIYMHGEASSTIAGKKSSMQASVNGFDGWAALRLYTFERARPEKEIIVGDLGYSVIRDVSLSRHSEGRIGSSYWPTSSSGNKMQAVRIRYKVRVNWVRNEVELVGSYQLTNAQILANEWGRNTYYNKLGERDVVYKIPEARFGFYVTGTA